MNKKEALEIIKRGADEILIESELIEKVESNYYRFGGKIRVYNL